MFVLLVLLYAATLGVSQECHPVCMGQCNSEVARCKPVCETPACVSHGCSMGAPARCFFPTCRVSCPGDQCQGQCPVCETLCDPLPSVCVQAGCEIECPETECSWKCRQPEDPPVCQWACEAPACATPSAAWRLVPLTVSTVLLLFLIVV